MCLSTVYMNSESGQITVMKDVARIEAEANGLRIDLDTIDARDNSPLIDISCKLKALDCPNIAICTL
jgi:tRNA (Thr-GGU) A37 N-methylase